jgi:bifunctional DNA-binding transcriptional regulator/antitoxin component of YhaV-PrlF toxin-antitoxin module
MKEIGKTWISGNSSCTLVIPKDMAQRAGIYQPSQVVISETKDGLLLKKLAKFSERMFSGQ